MKRAGSIIFFLAATHGAVAKSNDDLVVYITCGEHKGSGVIVSSEGHLLTVNHVAKGGGCFARIGNKSNEKLALLDRGQIAQFDAHILQLPPSRSYGFVPFCPVSDNQGNVVRAKGFIPGYNTPHDSAGIISSTEMVDGKIATDAHTSPGKSGGPVFLDGTNAIIGIIAGAEYHPAGDVETYEIVPVEYLKSANLTKSENCTPSQQITLEEHEAKLEARLREKNEQIDDLRKHIKDLRGSLSRSEHLSDELSLKSRDLKRLQDERAAVSARLSNVEADWLEDKAKLADLSDGTTSKQETEIANQTLMRGDTSYAKKLYQKIAVEQAPTVKRVAHSEFKLGLIAAYEVRWLEAYTHFEAAARLDPTSDHLFHALEYARRIGNFESAHRHGADLLDVVSSGNKKGSGREAIALNAHALTLDALGRYLQSEAFYREALDIGKDVFGSHHPVQLSHLNNLAVHLDTMARYTEAETYFRQVLEHSESSIGRGDQRFATYQNNLAGLLMEIGKYDEAKLLYQASLDARIKLFGDIHPDVAQSQNNLAKLLSATGNFGEAEALYAKARQTISDTLGQTNADYAVVLNNLAELMLLTGNQVEAERLFDEDIAVTLLTLGDQHPSYAVSLVDQGDLFQELGRHEQATENYERALEILEQVLGPDHPKSVDTRRKMKS